MIHRKISVGYIVQFTGSVAIQLQKAERGYGDCPKPMGVEISSIILHQWEMYKACDSSMPLKCDKLCSL
jgi:hypothetical protein